MDEQLCTEEDFVEWFGTRASTIRCKIENRGSGIGVNNEE